MTMRDELLKQASRANVDGFDTFVKVAHQYLGREVDCVPPQTMRQAYQIYRALPPEKRASRALEYYEEIEPGREKIALKAVAANVLADVEKQAMIPAAALTAAKSLGAGVSKAIGNFASSAKPIMDAVKPVATKAMNGFNTASNVATKAMNGFNTANNVAGVVSAVRSTPTMNNNQDSR